MAWPISTALATALAARDRKPLWRAEVTLDGAPVPSAPSLRVESGTVNISTGGSGGGSLGPDAVPATSSRSCSLTLVDDGGNLVPKNSSDALAPFGNEISLYASLDIGGAVEWVPVGVFGIQSAVSAWAGGAVTVAVSGKDRATRVAGDDLTDYLQIDAGTLLTDAITTLVSDALPAGQLYNFTPLTTTISAQTYAPGDDRWDAAVALATNAGCLLEFDPAGVLTLRAIPDVSTAAPAFRFAPGDNSVMVTVQNSYDRTDAANVILVTAQGTGIDTPLTALARDTNPDSPTYVDGSFGKVVKSISTSVPTTQDDTQTFADSQLKLYAGVTQQAEMTCLSLFHLGVWDVIQARASKVALDGRYAIDQISLGLGIGDKMSITTRGVVTNA